MLQEEDFRSQKIKTLAEWIKGLREGTRKSLDWYEQSRTPVP